MRLSNVLSLAPMKRRFLRYLATVCLLGLSLGLLSCSSMTKQSEEPETQSGGPVWSSTSTISPELASMAEGYTLYCYGQLFALNGDLDEALAEYEKAARRLPASSHIGLEQGRTLLEQGKLNEAIVKLDLAVQNMPNLGEAHALCGDAHRLLLDIPEAINCYREAVRLGFDESRLRLTMVELLYASRQYEAAIGELRKMLDTNPESLPGHFLLGRLLLLVGKPGDAVPHLEQASSLRPDDSRITRLLFDAYSLSGEDEKALDLARAMVSRSPDDVMFRFHLARLLDEAGRTEEAIEHLKATISLQPDFATALNYLGYLYIDRGITVLKGIALVKSALALEPHNSAFLDSLGWGLLKIGKTDDAIEYLQKAISGVKDDPASEPIICAHLAIAYRTKGMLAEARKYLALIESAKSDDPALLKLIDALSPLLGEPSESSSSSARDDGSSR
ncbi:tetratricopeptide repeat protein [bacterium]|nr:tetratricopeptide repeat protein [bacterium]